MRMFLFTFFFCGKEDLRMSVFRVFASYYRNLSYSSTFDLDVLFMTCSRAHVDGRYERHPGKRNKLLPVRCAFRLLNGAAAMCATCWLGGMLKQIGCVPLQTMNILWLVSCWEAVIILVTSFDDRCFVSNACFDRTVCSFARSQGGSSGISLLCGCLSLPFNKTPRLLSVLLVLSRKR